MKQFSTLLRVMAVLAMLLFTISSTRATLLVYEGFNYPDGSTLTNASANSAGNSFGWAARWNGISASVAFATNVAGNLAYTDSLTQSLATDGGKVIIGVPGGITGNSQLSRSFNLGTLTGNTYSGLTNSATTYWASFLMQWIGQSTAGSTTNLYVRKGVLQFRQGALTNATSSGTPLLGIGSPNALNRLGTPYDTWSTWTGADAANGVQNTGLAASTNPLAQTTWVLTRIDLDGFNGLDTVYTWFNWTNLAVEPSLETASTTNNTVNEDGWNNIRVDANGGNASGTNTVLALDEFRLGTSFTDVAPIAALPQPPNITIHPASQTIVVTNPVTFSVTAVGDAPLRYQWYFNTTNVLVDQTNTSYTIASTTTNDSGGYSCVVTNNNGAETSLVATLTVVLPEPPAITAHPQNFTNVVGFSASFAVTATGTAPLRYQWYFNNTTPLAGKTNASLTFTIASTNEAGGYSAIVTNLYGAATSSVATLATVAASPAGLPAFPGADGAAKYITGGRGGIVYHVTLLDRNMNHSEAGTLRYGLTDGNFPPGVPRTIVFDVAGTFWLGRYGAESNHMHGWDSASRYNLSGNTTIAGQTAPGPVIIAGGVTKPGSVNTIVRNLLFAPSYGMRSFEDPPTLPTPGDFPDSFVFDALDISGQNIMLDHLTCIYATDETISANELAANVTVQYCTIAQGENYPQADAENPGSYSGHANGSLLQAGSNARMSVIHSLYAHQASRMPRVGSEIGTGAINDFRNNVFYNWFNPCGYDGPSQPSFNNFINNFYLAGNGGNDASGTNIVTSAGGTTIFSSYGGGFTRAYLSGNLKDTNKDGDPNDTSSADGNYGSVAVQATAYDVNLGVTLSSQTALTNTLRYTGARWWERDYDLALGNTGAINTVDERLAHEAITGTGQIIAWADDPFDSSPTEGLEWKGLLALRADTNTFAAPYNYPPGWDTDGDGLPDAWEAALGLNPTVPNNNGDFDADGYTDLEEYLNELAAWPAPGEIVFTDNTNNRYASIFNWRVNGVVVNIAGTNTTTASLWQPSRYDTAIISNRTVFVDAVGQHAGTLRLTNNAALNITNGWLSVASNLVNSASSTVCVISPGGLHVTNNLVSAGTLLLSGNAALTVGGTFTNIGTLDIMTWNGTLPGGFVNLGTVLDRSLVVMSSYGLSGTNFTATIQGYTKHSYQLQYRDDLGSGSWQNVASAVAGANAPINFIHFGGATAVQRFYRVMVSP